MMGGGRVLSPLGLLWITLLWSWLYRPGVLKTVSVSYPASSETTRRQ